MSAESDARVALLETLAEFTADELVEFVIDHKGGLTIHSTENEDVPERLCAHPGHDRERGYRGDSLRDVLIAALIDDRPEAGAHGSHD